MICAADKPNSASAVTSTSDNVGTIGDIGTTQDWDASSYQAPFLMPSSASLCCCNVASVVPSGNTVPSGGGYSTVPGDPLISILSGSSIGRGSVTGPAYFGQPPSGGVGGGVGALFNVPSGFHALPVAGS